jgi:uroporphyrinogen-III synthase
MTPTLVLTRPDAQSREIVAALGQTVPVIVSPIMRILPAGMALDIGRYAGVVLTSANALAHAPDLRGLAAWCVGRRTAEAAQAAGAEVRLVARDADDLVAQIKDAGPLVHLRGEHARGNVAKRLNLAGIDTDEVVIYRQEALPLSAEAKAIIEGAGPVVLPLYSPRSAKLLGEQIAAVGPRVRTIAMSAAVAEAWREATGEDADVAPAPTGEEMLMRIKAALGV